MSGKIHLLTFYYIGEKQIPQIRIEMWLMDKLICLMEKDLYIMGYAHILYLLNLD